MIKDNTIISDSEPHDGESNSENDDLCIVKTSSRDDDKYDGNCPNNHHNEEVEEFGSQFSDENITFALKMFAEIFRNYHNKNVSGKDGLYANRELTRKYIGGLLSELSHVDCKSSSDGDSSNDADSNIDRESNNADSNIQRLKELSCKQKSRGNNTDNSDFQTLCLNSDVPKVANNVTNSGEVRLKSNISVADTILESNCDVTTFISNSKYRKPKFARKVFNCFKCSYKSHQVTNYESHLLTHLQIKPYSCLFCSFETSYNSSLQQHKKLHPEYQIPLKKYPFKLRNFEDRAKSFNNISGIDDGSKNTSSHIGVDLSASQSNTLSVSLRDGLSTDACSVPCSSTTGDSLEAGNLELSEETKLDEQPEVLGCFFCSFSTKTNFVLNKHFKGKHPSYTEDLLNKANISLVENGFKIYPCPRCPCVSISLSGWNSHWRTHFDGTKNADFSTNDHVLSCKLCPFKTLNTGSLIKHITRHQR